MILCNYGAINSIRHTCNIFIFVKFKDRLYYIRYKDASVEKIIFFINKDFLYCRHFVTWQCIYYKE